MQRDRIRTMSFTIIQTVTRPQIQSRDLLLRMILYGVKGFISMHSAIWCSLRSIQQLCNHFFSFQDMFVLTNSFILFLIKNLTKINSLSNAPPPPPPSPSFSSNLHLIQYRISTKKFLIKKCLVNHRNKMASFKK